MFQTNKPHRTQNKARAGEDPVTGRMPCSYEQVGTYTAGGVGCLGMRGFSRVRSAMNSSPVMVSFFCR